MGAIKAFTLWFPLSRLATLNGLYLAVGGLGGLSATAPVEALLGPFGWRALFYCAAGLAAIAATLIFTVVPEKPLPGGGEPFGTQVRRFREVFASLDFWRICLPLVVCHAAYQAMQGLWLAPWLYDVADATRSAVANYLFAAALAYAIGSVFFGMTSDRLAQLGISRMTVFKTGLGISFLMFVLLAAGVKNGLGVILAIYGFTAISAALAYALLTPLFPPEMTGRVNTASNVLMFALSFAFQWGIGAVLRQFPVVDGRFSPEGYAIALGFLALAQAAVLLWLLPMREPVSQRAPALRTG